MRRLFIVTALFFTLASSVSAGQGLFGYRVGPNFANQYSTGIDDNIRKNLVTFHLGFVNMGPLSRHLAFQYEALYTVKGYKFDDGITLKKVKYGYLEVPILFKYFPIKLGPVRPAPYAGSAFAFRIHGNSSSTEKGLNSFYERFELSLAAGFSVNLAAFKGGDLVLDFRYTKGLTNINVGGIDKKNRVYSFSIGVQEN